MTLWGLSQAKPNCLNGREFYAKIVPAKTIGWRSGCKHGLLPPIPCRVLDPFNGSGTTGAVACALGRDYEGIELNPEYAAMAKRRIEAALHPATARTEEAADVGLFNGSGGAA